MMDQREDALVGFDRANGKIPQRDKNVSNGSAVLAINWRGYFLSSNANIQI